MSIVEPHAGNCATNLHGHESVIDHDLLGEEVGTYCRLVACAELLVDLCGSCKRGSLAKDCVIVIRPSSEVDSYILVHQARLANTTVTKDYDLHVSVEYNISDMECNYLEENLLP